MLLLAKFVSGEQSVRQGHLGLRLVLVPLNLDSQLRNFLLKFGVPLLQLSDFIEHLILLVLLLFATLPSALSIFELSNNENGQKGSKLTCSLFWA